MLQSSPWWNGVIQIVIGALTSFIWIMIWISVANSSLLMESELSNISKSLGDIWIVLLTLVVCLGIFILLPKFRLFSLSLFITTLLLLFLIYQGLSNLRF
ncbi:hypothetical protein CEY16_13980 [Halalkalibacillus sediminis]|uniref:Uncharacterized protein n=1 Tax=Halalkalibacillus sediminis TaxID=2018042 RepID=A0A2I0QS36_9BACI|nr:hypothetical protein CEY16_13980 [Halalkalibacillus sediminis]